jgi:predicted NACHT family NTPase
LPAHHRRGGRGRAPLTIAIAELIDATGGVLLLDGLDEMPPPLRRRAEHVIEVLARNVRESKLVVSCRSGDYSLALEGFDALEIRPLTAEQILTVAHKWCSDAADFVQRLQALPFADLATRPLFLCQLILLYETTAFLPSDPSAVYRRVVRLALEECGSTTEDQPANTLCSFRS